MSELEVILDIGGAIDHAQFPALLMPNDYVIVSGMPINRFSEVATSRVLIRSSNTYGAAERAVGTAGMRVFPDSNEETAVVLIKLELAVANVSIPESAGDQFPALVEQSGQDVVEALRAGGITAELLPQPWEPPIGHQPGRPQPPWGWTPFIPSDRRPDHLPLPWRGLCCWLGWPCCVY